jgi:RNA polymerase-binding transcription factor DksA
MTKTTKTSSEDRKRYEVLNRMLMDRQAEIRTKLRSLREVLPAEVAQVKDAEEQSMEDFVLGMDFALMEMESETLRQIDEAIQRLDDGIYGICAECDERISEARLKALPFATVCRDCQAQREDDQAARNARPSRFFEDGPPAAARERRSDKPARSWSAPARVAAVPSAPAPETRTIRAGKPARVSRD